MGTQKKKKRTRTNAMDYGDGLVHISYLGLTPSSRATYIAQSIHCPKNGVHIERVNVTQSQCRCHRDVWSWHDASELCPVGITVHEIYPFY